MLTTIDLYNQVGLITQLAQEQQTTLTAQATLDLLCYLHDQDSSPAEQRLEKIAWKKINRFHKQPKKVLKEFYKIQNSKYNS